MLADFRHMHEGQYLEAARGDDFIGVQAYSRTRLDRARQAARRRGGRRDAATWATSTGPRRSRRRSGTRPRSPAARSTSPRTASAPTTTRSGSGTSPTRSPASRRCLDDGLDVRGYFYWSLHGQLRVGLRLPAAVRARRRRPGDAAAHDQAQRHLARQRSPGPTASTDAQARRPHSPITRMHHRNPRL